MGGGSTRILCSPTVRNRPLKFTCFSSENQDHCQMPGRSAFMIAGLLLHERWRGMRHSEATASLTVFVTFARILASLGKSMMSSSGTVMNLRLAPLVSEMRNMLFDGVTGITTCTS